VSIRQIPPATRWRALVLALVFLPLFVQLDRGLYTDVKSVTGPRGVITNLPIPISVFVSAVAAAVMARRWIREPVVLLLGSTIPLMLVTSLVAGDGSVSWTKLKLLLFQFAVPMAGFALGREIARDAQAVRTGALLLFFTAATTVTAHLLSSWLVSRSALLSATVFGVGIYNHLQYVPVIVMSAYLLAVFLIVDPASGFSTRAGRSAVLFGVIVAFYLAASISMTATFGFWLALALLLLVIPASGRLVTGTTLVLAILISVIYTAVATPRSVAFQAKLLGADDPESGPHAEMAGLVEAGDPDVLALFDLEDMAAEGHARELSDRRSVPPRWRFLPNIGERTYFWAFYLDATTSSVRAFLFGHPEQPDMTRFPSAHNYYLDMLYNFGLPPLIPIAAIILRTGMFGLARLRDMRRSPALAGLAFLTALLLFVDNGLRVGMRQLYPGIATFLVWGLAFTMLETGARRVPLAVRIRRSGSPADAPQEPVTELVHKGIEQQPAAAQRQQLRG